MFDIHGAASGSKDECTNTLPIPARGEKEVRRLLRTKRMPWSCPNKRDAYHRTALHHAAASGNAEVLALLLDFDATPGLKDKAGITPLMMAIRNGHEDAAHLLLEAFAHLDLQDHPVQELTPEGDGPLLLAVKSGYPGMLKLLLRYSEDVDAMDANGWTALHLASRDGKEEMVEFLLLAGANVDGRSAPPLRHTPLHEACYTGQLEVVRTLLVSRAAADLQSGTGDTALHLAAALAGPQAPAIVALLLDAGADPELQNDAGQRPHDLARRSEVRKLLANTSGQAARYHFRNYLYRVQQDTHPRLQAAAPDPGARPGEATASKRKLAGSNAAGTGARSTQADVLQKKAVAPGPAAPAKKRSAFGPTTSSSGVKAEPGSDLGEAPAPHNDSAAAAPGVESEPAAEAGSRGAAGRGGHTQVVEGLQSMLTQLEGMRSRLSDLEGTIAGTRWQPARSGVGGEERGGGSWGKAAPEPSREGLPLPGTGPPPLCSRPAGPGREEAGVGAATVPFATDDGEAFREALAREEREAQEQLVWECAVLEPEAGRYRRRTQRDLQPAPTRHVVLKDAWSCAKA